jgi:predicted nucleic acid-binding protein
MVSRYGLDTTFLIDLMRGDPSAKLLAKEIGPNHLTTHINLYELFCGFYSTPSQDTGLILEQAQFLFSELTPLPLTEKASHEAARITGYLFKKGQPIEDTDCLSAAIFLSNDCTTIVTRNAEHFQRIPGLKVKTY